MEATYFFPILYEGGNFALDGEVAQVITYQNKMSHKPLVRTLNEFTNKRGNNTCNIAS